MSDIFSTLSGIVFVAAFGPYLRAILRGETKPMIVTWVLWLSLDLIFGFQMYSADTLNWQILGAIVGSSLVIALSVRHGDRAWDGKDVLRLIGSATALLVWLISGSATIGMVVTTTVLVVGAIPTFTSAWNNPELEDKLAWAMFFASCLLQLAALGPIRGWTLETALQPLSFTFIETVMVMILFVLKRKP